MTQTIKDRGAAFFDVDGTLVACTVVHYYSFFRRRLMSPSMARLWSAAYLCKCLGYLVLDAIDRSRFNVAFYRGYRGMSVDAVRALVPECHHNLIRPRCFADADQCIARHRDAGQLIVLVTGSIDFIIRPLADELGADHVVAPALVIVNGRFTGELDGVPVSDHEKARRVRRFAAQHNVELSQSHAYGDSIADLPMLECVGHPRVVNPDRRLAAVARSRGWPVSHWSNSVRSHPDQTIADGAGSR